MSAVPAVIIGAIGVETPALDFHEARVPKDRAREAADCNPELGQSGGPRFKAIQVPPKDLRSNLFK